MTQFTKACIRLLAPFTIIATSLLFSSCDNSSQNENSGPIGNKAESQIQDPVVSQFRDWSNIIASGEIRALKLTWESDASLPRLTSTALYHQQLFQQFADIHGLTIRWVPADSLAHMFQRLANNEADIIPRHLTRLDSRQQGFEFTRIVTNDKEQLVGAAAINDFSIDAVNQILLPEESSYLETAKQYPSWQIRAQSMDVSQLDQLADQLVAQPGLLTILDKSAVDSLLSYRDDIKVFHQFDEPTAQSWLINKKQPALLNKLNNFIQARAMQRIFELERNIDLGDIKKKKLPLRMITRNSPETYFLWRGELMGFEYDLMKEFAKRQGLTLQVIVARTYEDMTRMLEEGRGDVIAAGLSRTDERKQEHTFSIRYNRVDEMIVAHKDSPTISSLDDLNGRSLHLRKSSAFWKTGLALQESHDVTLIPVPESFSTEMLINQIADEEIDLTIADSNLVAIEKNFREEIVAPLVLNESIPWAYIIRKNNPQLLNALNAYIRKEYRQTFYNVIKQKYFSDKDRKELHRQDRVTRDSELSPFDDLVREHAQRHNFDWRLITAQMYQESKFNPTAQSGAGAQGLMQVLPSTAEELGYDNLGNPEEGIAAGVDYLNWTKQRFTEDLPLEERLFFALAAYNAGYGHVYDAKRLANEIGLDPNKWFNNVERAMLLLQQPSYYKKSRFGYVRGSEPVNYVRSIHQRYLSYLEITQ